MRESLFVGTDIALQFVSELLTIIHLNEITGQLVDGDSHLALHRKKHMGQLIEFVPRKIASDGTVPKALDEDKKADQGSKGQLLFFTGVRYERSATLPSQRLKMPIGKS